MIRFWEKVEIAEEGCWLWTAAKARDGYGLFQLNPNRMIAAHRLAWVLSGRVLAKGKVLHHRCENRACVNPGHLQVQERAAHGKLHSPFHERCIRGHNFTLENTYIHPRGYRICRQCRAILNREYRARAT